ncbi:glycine betaine/proline transport system ATP-binding protein [Desulfocicer vacuolatum DSM 3385]|uniref:Glycine betaine/proline transport system ATP-binding protein n=1 Tax=Desulfocicer vacuolatum DSM 3385 TaxID=1121400 RepID=A0A1W2ATC5_9BACT|nr:glycine betaine/L-proline ABC transporter ATP-binding protein [Desulfocicer vacuolatum]SMC63947.1 glycine betaine/proline transport system ATP-binding protein [Desulfocicer vacuolatum DSM 3385]
MTFENSESSSDTTVNTDSSISRGGTPDGVPAIECRNVWKIYGKNHRRAHEAVKNENLNKERCLETYGCVVGVMDASFSVDRGEIFCIMGLSGSGKSTLMRHINRLIEPTDGQILINGQDVNALSEPEMRQLRSEKIGMVFQNMALLPHRNVRDNVSFGLEVRKVPRKERNEAAERALGLVQLNGWGDQFPKELSGGMQQRVGLARALASDPDILLMDEPFSALDPLIRRQLQDQFLELSSKLKKTTLFITHDLDEAIRIGDHIAIMKDGILVQTGTPEEIVTNPADDYVADFVAGISRLHLVTAHSVMYPVEDFLQRFEDAKLDSFPTVDETDDLDHLVEMMTDVDADRVAVISKGKIVGVVTRRSLLRGIQGKPMENMN